MNASQFLRNPFDQAEEWEDERELKIFREYKTTSLQNLIEDYSNTEEKEEPDRKRRLKVLKEIIAWKLGIPIFDYFIDCLNERFEMQLKEIEKLTKFKEHRHKTIMGLYTEKPNY